MSTNVYWACIEDQWMLAEEPELVSKKFYTKYYYDQKPLSMIQKCPVFNASLTNLYSLKSIYNYQFTIENNQIYSNEYDKNFFENHVTIRNIENKFFSFKNSYIFFTDKDSLETTFYEYPFFEDNNITKSCIIVPGKYDIGKWFRNTEFAFYFKNDINSFKIEKDEIFSYIRFNTKEKIKFKQFYYTKKLKKYQIDGFKLNGFVEGFEEYYNKFKLKKLILKEINNNLI